MCRAHQVVEDGYEFFARRQLVTLFSAPNYCGEFDNAGAMMSVDETLMCSFQVNARRMHWRGVVWAVCCLEYLDLLADLSSPRGLVARPPTLHSRGQHFPVFAQILKPAEKKRMFAAGAQGARPATPPSKAAARK